MKWDNLRKFVCPEIVYGNGALELTGRYGALYGVEKVLVVTDPGVVAAGWTAKVVESLETAGIRYVLFDAVSVNPRDHEVMSGVERYAAAGCDALVAVGGGSPIDCAKGIGISWANRCDITACEGVDRVAVPMPPLLCIPTTAGSAADASQFAIITNTARRVKMAIVSKAVVPDVTLVDPLTTATLDPYLTACTGMDALVHAIEAYVSNASSPLTDLHALEAIRLVGGALLAAVRDSLDPVARSQMMLGSLEAGLAFSNASLGAIHAMAHSLGGTLDLPHGECNAIFLDHVVAFNFPAAPERYRAIAEALGLRSPGAAAAGWRQCLVDELRRIKTEAGIDRTLGRLGVTPADLPRLAENAMKDACMVTNPRRPTVEEIGRIYAEAL